jgi:hypothetical protein
MATVDENIPENRLAPLHVFRFEVKFQRDAPFVGPNNDPVPLCSGAFAECTGLEATMEPRSSSRAASITVRRNAWAKCRSPP